MPSPITVLGIAGSLRKGSYNVATLRAAQALVPQGARIETFDRLGEIPLFNEDTENDPHPAVIELKQRIRAADAILIVTPEYNYSVPGVLKNAIDCASRPYGDNAWQGKPVALMSASISIFGGARAQYHLRQSFVFLDMYPVNQPEVMIPSAADRFDDEGNLTDDMSKDLIKTLLRGLVDRTHRLRAAA